MYQPHAGNALLTICRTYNHTLFKLQYHSRSLILVGYFFSYFYVFLSLELLQSWPDVIPCNHSSEAAPGFYLFYSLSSFSNHIKLDKSRWIYTHLWYVACRGHVAQRLQGDSCKRITIPTPQTASVVKVFNLHPEELACTVKAKFMHFQLRWFLFEPHWKAHFAVSYFCSVKGGNTWKHKIQTKESNSWMKRPEGALACGAGALSVI